MMKLEILFFVTICISFNIGAFDLTDSSSSYAVKKEEKCIVEEKFLKFETPSESEIPDLVEFAVKSNDTYKTRTAPVEVAYDVFGISKIQIEKGLVEKLVHTQCKLTLGFYSLKAESRSKTDIELGHLFVRPGYFRKGIGKKLFFRVVEKAKKLSKKKLYWISDPDASLFYDVLGAKKVGEDSNLLNPSVPVPLYEYDL